MRKLLALLLLIGTSSSYGYDCGTGCWQAATANSADIQAKITQAANGETIKVPAQTGTWSNLNINKAVKIIGAGVGKTIINKVGNASYFTLTAPSGTSDYPRVSGFTFLTNQNTTAGKWVGISGAIHGFRVDHCDFEVTGVTSGTISGLAVHVETNGEPHGVFDHCHWSRWFTGDTIQADAPGWGGKQNGDGSFHDVSYRASEKMIYFEDCIFEQPTFGVTMLEGGARVCIRYSFMWNDNSGGGHGPDSGGQAGGRYKELYNNYALWHQNSATAGSGDGMVFNTRTASGVIFNVRGRNANKLTLVNAYRAWLSNNTYGLADGANPFDKNKTGSVITTILTTVNRVDPPNSGDPVGAGDIYARGIYHGGTLNDLGDNIELTIPLDTTEIRGAQTGAPAPTNQWRGFNFINNKLKGEVMAGTNANKRYGPIITTNDSGHVTIYGKGGYTGNNFTIREGDDWEIRCVDASIHQAGRGYGDLVKTKVGSGAGQWAGASFLTTDAGYANNVSLGRGWPRESDGTTTDYGTGVVQDGGLWFKENMVSPTYTGTFQNADTFNVNNSGFITTSNPMYIKVPREILLAQLPPDYPVTTPSAGSTDPLLRIGPDDETWDTFAEVKNRANSFLGLGGTNPTIKANTTVSGTLVSASFYGGYQYPYYGGTSITPQFALFTEGSTNTSTLLGSGFTGTPTITLNGSWSPGTPANVSFGTPTCAANTFCGTAATAASGQPFKDYTVPVHAVSGAQTADITFTLRVQSAPSSFPTCGISTPTDASTFINTQAVPITATFGDSDGTISSVRINIGQSRSGITSSNGSTTINGTFSAADVGKLITGTNIPSDTFINSIGGTTSAVMSKAATGATGSNVIYGTFSQQANPSGSTYTYNWSGMATGSYSIIASATDNTSQTTYSAPVVIVTIVPPPTPTPPAQIILKP